MAAAARQKPGEHDQGQGALWLDPGRPKRCLPGRRLPRLRHPHRLEAKEPARGIHKGGIVEGDAGTARKRARLSQRLPPLGHRQRRLPRGPYRQRSGPRHPIQTDARARRTSRLHEIPHRAGLSTGRRQDQSGDRGDRDEAARCVERLEAGAGAGDRGHQEGRPPRRSMTLAATAAESAAAPHPRSLRRQRRRFLLFCLAPALAVLIIVTLAPMAYLLLTSFTPLNLTNPASEWDFRQPLLNYELLPADARFLNSLWVQAKLSFWTVSLQLVIGFGFALLLNLKSGLVRAARTAFLIPMVLPPIVVAIIWKVLYTPDISPAHWALRALGWNVPALITNPDWALTAIIIADTWEWFPLTMLMVLAALQTVPEDLLDAARVDGAGRAQTTEIGRAHVL